MIVMKLSVCLETVYTDRELPQRAAALKQHGVDSFELWSLEGRSAIHLNGMIAETQCSLALFCGNRRHSIVDPAQRAAFLDELTANLRVARQLLCPSLTLLSDAVDDYGIPIRPPTTLSRTERLEGLREGLATAAELAEPTGVRLVVEPLNSVLDHPGYTLDDVEDAFQLVRSIGHRSLKVLLDVYHAQMMQTDVAQAIKNNLEWIGHVHIADVPGRHEPGTGLINFAKIAQLLASNDYAGHVGLECIPAADSSYAIQQFVRTFEPCLALHV